MEFLKNYIEHILDSEDRILEEIKKFKLETQQNVLEEKFLKDLLILRYIALHAWFFELIPSKNKKDLEKSLLIINQVLKDVLKSKGKSDCALWLVAGFFEYTDFRKLASDDWEKESTFVKRVELNFQEKMGDRINRIAYDCTGGRLGGELHNSIIELVMTTICKDRKVFNQEKDISLNEEEVKDIKNMIEEMTSSREEAKEEFLKELLGEDEKKN